MTLKDIPVGERLRLTNGYPCILASASGGGKSTAFANLSLEDKKRTFIINMDDKMVSENDEDFYKVIHPRNKSDKLSYLIEDDEAILKIQRHIMQQAKNDKVDRIVIDTSTEMLKFLQLWASEHYSGYETWGQYNDGITHLFNTFKEAVNTYGKFVYILAHYPPKVKGTSQPKRFLTSKGKEHTNVLEEKTVTVVESVLEDRAFWFYADSWEESDTTKTKVNNGSFKFKRHSIDDLEVVLTGQKKAPEVEV